jgi:hypothetical protein
MGPRRLCRGRDHAVGAAEIDPDVVTVDAQHHMALVFGHDGARVMRFQLFHEVEKLPEKQV